MAQLETTVLAPLDKVQSSLGTPGTSPLALAIGCGVHRRLAITKLVLRELRECPHRLTGSSMLVTRGNLKEK